MASRIKTMTEGKPSVLILTFALPLMIGNVFQQLYTAAFADAAGNHRRCAFVSAHHVFGCSDCNEL